MDKKPTGKKLKKKTSGLKLAVIFGAVIFLIAAAVIGVFVAIEINRREQYAQAQSATQEFINDYNDLDGASADTFDFESQKINVDVVGKNLEVIKSKRASFAKKMAELEDIGIIKDDEEAASLLAKLKKKYTEFDNSMAIAEEAYSFIASLGVFNDLPDFENINFTSAAVKDAAAKLKAAADAVNSIPEPKYDANKEYITALKTYYNVADTIWGELGSCIDRPQSCNQSIISQAEDPTIESSFMAATAKFQNYFLKLFNGQELADDLNALGKYLTDKSNGK
jgi:hypothetical protein